MEIIKCSHFNINFPITEFIKLILDDSRMSRDDKQNQFIEIADIHYLVYWSTWSLEAPWSFRSFRIILDPGINFDSWCRGVMKRLSGENGLAFYDLKKSYLSFGREKWSKSFIVLEAFPIVMEVHL